MNMHMISQSEEIGKCQFGIQNAKHCVYDNRLLYSVTYGHMERDGSRYDRIKQNISKYSAPPNSLKMAPESIVQFLENAYTAQGKLCLAHIRVCVYVCVCVCVCVRACVCVCVCVRSRVWYVYVCYS